MNDKNWTKSIIMAIWWGLAVKGKTLPLYTAHWQAKKGKDTQVAMQGLNWTKPWRSEYSLTITIKETRASTEVSTEYVFFRQTNNSVKDGREEERRQGENRYFTFTEFGPIGLCSFRYYSVALYFCTFHTRKVFLFNLFLNSPLF